MGVTLGILADQHMGRQRTTMQTKPDICHSHVIMASELFPADWTRRELEYKSWLISAWALPLPEPKVPFQAPGTNKSVAEDFFTNRHSHGQTENNYADKARHWLKSCNYAQQAIPSGLD